MERIQVRGRKEEAGITLDFLAGLRAYYDTFEGVARQKYDLNLLTIDLQSLDMRTPEGEMQLANAVRANLGWEDYNEQFRAGFIADRSAAWRRRSL